MHILYFHQHFSTPDGSIGTRSYEISLEMIRRGHTVTMVCGTYQGAVTGLQGLPQKGLREGRVDGIRVLEIQLPYSNHDRLLKRSITFLRFAFKSIRIALRTKYDLLFATSTPLTAGIPGIVMRVLKPRRRFVFEVRDLWPELPREMGVIRNPLLLGLLSFLEWLSYRAAHACIGLSPGIVSGIQKRCPKKKPVTMIPNGCDLDLFPPDTNAPPHTPPASPPASTSAPDPKIKLKAIFTGAHGQANGLDAVLDAARVLQERHREDIQVVFLGDGKLKPKLQQRAASENLHICQFHAPVPKRALPAIFQEVGVGLMILKNVPAFYEGTSPNKFFDYLAAGLPVLNNYPGWISQQIQAQDCGIVVPPDDPSAFADALEFLADHPEGRQRMGHNARRLAVSEFDRKTLAAQAVIFLENICNPGAIPLEPPPR